jgi:2'-5' RNA ligase
MKRTFIAIDIPASPKINECLNTMSFRLAGEKIRWVDGNNLHLTLKFLGDTGEKRVSDIKIILKELTQNFSAFSITIRNVGVFKNLRNPRIIWLGIDACSELMLLNAEIESQISRLGFPAEERRFSPHLTVGRIKFLENNQGLLQIMKAFEEQVLHQFIVPEVTFYESILMKEGPEYIPLGKYRLRNP